MQGAGILNLRRASAFTAALAIHIALLLVVAGESSSHRPLSSAQGFISTWIVLQSNPAPRTPRELILHQPLSPPLNPIQIETPDIQPVPISPDEPGRATDWTLEMQRSAIAIPETSRTRNLGHLPEVDSPMESHHPEAIHRAGESYRDANGNNVAWVTDNCYVISAAPPPGTPDVFARMTPTRTACIHPSAPEGQLFKDLQAYKKFHPP